jgi:peptide chain release factor 2
MKGEYDNYNALLEINAGVGGTDAQDWAEMLLRMYLRWIDKRDFTYEELDYQAGETAGLKSCTLAVRGKNAFGWLRAERGVHRLVRISPFNAGGKRQTSFASVTVIPEFKELESVAIESDDLRIDTYRSSGAGGQHVNKTDSAVRITHLPTGTVVACQNERSQLKNKERALAILKSKLYELELRKRQDEINSSKGVIRKIDFGSQIRSYVLHPYKMVKDLRTGYETSSVDKVLDGDINPFIESFLLSSHNV